MPKLEDKVALITGASAKSGIGATIARKLAREGAKIAVTDLTLEGRGLDGWRGLVDLVEEIQAVGSQAIALEMDVTNFNQVNEAVAEVIRQFGKIDILVNSAGSPVGPDRVPVVELDEEIFDLVHRVNMKGTFLCSKAVAQHLLQRNEGGKIINISAGGGLKGAPQFAAYSSSKFAVLGFTQCLAQELGPYNIQVNAVCPGIINNERLDEVTQAISPEDADINMIKEIMQMQIPLRKLGSPEDIANTVAFLVSDDSSFITGQAISVCGGMYMLS